MDLTVILLILIVFLGIGILFFVLRLYAPIAAVIDSQKTIRDSIQMLSEQLSDVEEKQKSIEADMRKIVLVLRAGTDKQWYSY